MSDKYGTVLSCRTKNKALIKEVNKNKGSKSKFIEGVLLIGLNLNKGGDNASSRNK